MTELDLLLLYALVAFFCVIVNGMLLNRTLATKYKESIDNSYCLLLLFFIAFSLVDGIWGLFASPLVLNSYYGYWIATYGFHFMASWSAFIWSGYLVAYLRPKKSVRTALQTVRWLLISALMAIWGSNFFTHGVFVITEEVVYVTKPLRKMLFYLQFSYYVIFTLYILISLLTVREKKHRKRYFSAMVFSSIPLLTGIFQLIWPDGPMYSMGFMLAAVTVYSFNITASREKYMEKSFEQENSKFMSLVAGLSEDFIYLILVDMGTGRYEMYCRGKNDGKLIEKLHSGSDFFTDRDMGFSYVSLCEEDLLLARNSLSRENIAAELTEKKSFSFAYRVRTESGTRYNLCKVIRSGSGNRVIIGLFDDDERIRLEMERQEQLEAAVEAAESLNKAKNQFFFNMSHDIRTPMNAIVGFTKIALKHMDESSVVASSLSKIDVAGKHLLSLINDVLDMSQIESGKLLLDNHPIEIQQSLGTILPIIEQSAGEKHLDFSYSISDIRHSVIVCDHLRVNQLLLNLLSNAVKYTGAGGKVSLSIDELESDDAEKAVYRFVVKDTGIGMSREFLAHIFEDFTREYNSTTSGTEGTGLGMSIVKKIVDLMNGTIDVQSEPNVGTTVTCVLSFGIANLDEISESRMHAHEPSDMDFSGKRVLLTDDNGLNREIAKDMLEDMKIEVEEAEDGTAAVEKVSEKPAGYYDCVLMDVQMPIMDGYEATRRIRALADRNKAGVPIIALTANAFGQDKINAIDAGMNAHLAKPIDPEAFLTVLSDLLNRKETVI